MTIDLDGWSGLRPPEGNYPGAPRVEMLPVRLQRLDELIPADLPVRFIKIDVEGAELQGTARRAAHDSTLAPHGRV